MCHEFRDNDETLHIDSSTSVPSTSTGHERELAVIRNEECSGIRIYGVPFDAPNHEGTGIAELILGNYDVTRLEFLESRKDGRFSFLVIEMTGNKRASRFSRSYAGRKPTRIHGGLGRSHVPI